MYLTYIWEKLNHHIAFVVSDLNGVYRWQESNYMYIRFSSPDNASLDHIKYDTCVYICSYYYKPKTVGFRYKNIPHTLKCLSIPLWICKLHYVHPMCSFKSIIISKYLIFAYICKVQMIQIQDITSKSVVYTMSQ